MSANPAVVTDLVANPAPFKAGVDIAQGAYTQFATNVAAMQAEAAQIFQATRTPLEQFAVGLEKADLLLRQGAIDAETYDRQIKRLSNDMQAASQAGGGGKTGALYDLKSVLGKSSFAGLLTKTMMGGGAVMALGMITGMVEGVAKGIEGWAEAHRKGGGELAKYEISLLRTLPVIGHIFGTMEAISNTVWPIPPDYNKELDSIGKLREKIKQQGEDLAAVTEEEKKKLEIARNYKEQMAEVAEEAKKLAAKQGDPTLANAIQRDLEKQITANRDKALAIEEARPGLEAQKKLEEEIAAATKTHQEAISQLTMSERELLIYKYMEQGISAQVAEAWAGEEDAAKKANEAKKKAVEEAKRAAEEEVAARKKADEALSEYGKNVHESLLTPTQKYREELKRLQEALVANKLTKEDYTGAVAKLAEEAQAAMDAKEAKTKAVGWGGIESAMSGFGRMAEAAATFKSGEDDQKKVVVHTKEIADAQRDALKFDERAEQQRERMIEAMKNHQAKWGP